MASEITTEKIWQEYDAGTSYNASIGLKETVERNENMFVGRQWEGLEHETVYPIVLNFIKPAVLNKCAHLMSEDIQIAVRPEGVEGQLETEQEARVNILNAALARIWETQALTARTRETLRDAAVTGDGCWHVAYDMGSGQEPGVVAGDIAVERFDNLNVMFGNPGDARIQEQPFVLLISREYADKVRRRAPAGLEVEPEEDGYFGEKNLETKLVTVITRYWRDWDTGRIWGCEAVRQGFLREPYDTGLTRYPVIFMNWERVRGSYHGEAVVSEMVGNQVVVNKMATLRSVSLARTAYPTIIYRDDILPNGWDNSVGAAIGVAGGASLQDVAYMLDGARHNPQADNFTAELIELTKGLNGATDAALGDVKPDNTSAIIAAQKAATTPLELVRQSLYQFMEDFARVCIEMIGQYYGPRPVAVSDDMMGELVVMYDFSQVRPSAYKVKIDVGGSSYWSEFTEVATLDNLFNKGMLDPITYVEFLPDGVLPQRQKLEARLVEQKQEAMMMGGAAVPPPTGGG